MKNKMKMNEKTEDSTIVANNLAQEHQHLTMLLNMPRRDSQTLNLNKAPPHTTLATPSPIPVPTTESVLTPKLQNVVATVDLQCPLDLRKISFRTRNSEYNPQRFTGIVMRIREPRTTALIFSSGKVVVTGARNESDVKLAARKYTAIVKKLGFNVQFSNFRIQNIVATIDLKFPIKLEQLHQMHYQFSSYEPELFPGLIYRLVKPRVVLLIFVNGRIVMTGAKLREELEEAIENMFPILKSFKK